MSYGRGQRFHLVVRRNKISGEYKAGAASFLPLSKWAHIKSFGKWSGAQREYRPYKRAEQEAKRYASTMNRRHNKK